MDVMLMEIIRMHIMRMIIVVIELWMSLMVMFVYDMWLLVVMRGMGHNWNIMMRIVVSKIMMEVVVIFPVTVVVIVVVFNTPSMLDCMWIKERIMSLVLIEMMSAVSMMNIWMYYSMMNWSDMSVNMVDWGNMGSAV